MVRVFLPATVMDYTRVQIYQLRKFRAPVWLVERSAKFAHTRIVYIDGYGIYTRANLSAYKVLYCNVSIKFLAYRIATLGLRVQWLCLICCNFAFFNALGRVRWNVVPNCWIFYHLTQFCLIYITHVHGCTNAILTRAVNLIVCTTRVANFGMRVRDVSRARDNIHYVCVHNLALHFTKQTRARNFISG